MEKTTVNFLIGDIQ